MKSKKETMKDEKIKNKDKKPGKETTGQTTQGALFKKGKQKESKFIIRSHFMEGAINETTREVPVIIIQEGLGNSRDKNFYTQEAFTKSYKLFDGAQCYADHPTKTEESDRPERSTRDLIGYYKNPEVIDFKGKKAIKATLKINDGESYNWAWDLVKEAIAYAKEYPDKDLVGISINASGLTEAGTGTDDLSINYVKEITDVFSADVVTKPGAGGKIGTGLKESVSSYKKAKAKKNLTEAKMFKKEAFDKAVKEMETLKGKMEAGEVEDGAAPKAIDEIINSLKALMSDEGDGGETEDGETEEEAKAKAEAEAKAKAEADAAAADGAAEPDGDEGTDPKAKAKAKEAARVLKLEEENFQLKESAKLRESADMVNRLLRESHLPAGTYDSLKLHLIGKDEAYAKKMIEAKKKEIASLLGLKAKVEGNGEMSFTESTTGAKPLASIYDGMEKVQK